MIIFLGIGILIGVLTAVDCVCYVLAKYPERCGIGHIPFIGGPLALWKYGRDKKSGALLPNFGGNVVEDQPALIQNSEERSSVYAPASKPCIVCGLTNQHSHNPETYANAEANLREKQNMSEFLKPYTAVRGENIWYVEGPWHHRSDYEFDCRCEGGCVCKSASDAKHLATVEAGILNRAYNAGLGYGVTLACNYLQEYTDRYFK